VLRLARATILPLIPLFVWTTFFFCNLCMFCFARGFLPLVPGEGENLPSVSGKSINLLSLLDDKLSDSSYS
jgi:hypothetical protein